MKKTAPSKKKKQRAKISEAADVRTMVGQERRAILQAILNKAKQGSYAHARFLFELAGRDEGTESEEAWEQPCEALRELVEELEAKHAKDGMEAIV